MLKAVEAIIEPDGTIRTLEPLQVNVPTRAILTVLAPLAENGEGNGAKILAFLQSPRFANRPVADPLEVAKRIEHLRNDRIKNEKGLILWISNCLTRSILLRIKLC